MQDDTSPGWLNLAVAVWLFLSAFIWPHGRAQFVNTLLVGAACIAVAMFATSTPRLRYVELGLALWLLVSTWILPTVDTATAWNNSLTSAVIIATALAAHRRDLRLGHGHG